VYIGHDQLSEFCQNSGYPLEELCFSQL